MNTLTPDDIAEFRRAFSALNLMASAAHSNAVAHGFYDEPADCFISTTCANISREVGELWDAHCRGILFDPCDKAEKMKALGLPELTCAEEEFADLILRVVGAACHLKIDLAKACAVKHAYNTTRPYRHGGKLA